MKKYLIIISVLLMISALLNAFLLVQKIDLPSGGGCYKDSPDKRYVLHLISFKENNPIIFSKGIWGEVWMINNSTKEKVRQVIIKPASVDYDAGYRELEKAITWKDDSSEVSIILPHVTLNIKVPSK
ncbi:MAG: hypothetical protein NT118_09775 [Lentisphaerae bacterium]|nr:hypothetical protein [Lentisphaerota bacterium]